MEVSSFDKFAHTPVMSKKYLLTVISVIFVIFYLVYILTTTRITVKFDKLEPFRHRLPVYYNGFKLGYTTRVYPDKDFKSTCVDLLIAKKNLQLPLNTTAAIKRKDKKDYIELIYPDSPYLAHLKNGDVISGKTGINFENFLQQQALSGSLDEMKDNLNNTIVSAQKTLDASTEMIHAATEILHDISPDIKNTIGNLNSASKDFASSAAILNKELSKGYLDKSLRNIEITTSNLADMTGNFNDTSNKINTESINMLNCVVKNINILINNINNIVVCVGNTLSKNLGGLRLLFTKTVK